MRSRPARVSTHRMNRAEMTNASSRGVGPGSISASPDRAMSCPHPLSMIHSRSANVKARGTTCPGCNAEPAAFAAISSAVASRDVTSRLPERAGDRTAALKLIGLIGMLLRGAAPKRSLSTLWKYSRIQESRAAAPRGSGRSGPAGSAAPERAITPASSCPGRRLPGTRRRRRRPSSGRRVRRRRPGPARRRPGSRRLGSPGTWPRRASSTPA